MSKVIWIINEYAGTPYHGMEFRHYYLGRELVNRGYKVYIVTASYSHLFFNKPIVKSNFEFGNIDGINYIWVKVPKYEHSHDKRRVLKWLLFTLKTYFFLPVSKIKKPDAIIVSSPAPFPIIAGYKWANKFNAKLIFEVRDLWPLTLIELGGFSPKNPFIKYMEYLEQYAYKKADKVVSLLPLAYKHMIKKGLDVKKFVYIPNGICIEDFKESEPLPEKIRKLIPNNKFIITYAGTFGKANALEYLIQAAALLKKYKNIHFLLVGKGMEESNLKKMVKKLNLSNITFLPPVPKKQVQEILKLSDVCYIGWRKKKLYQFGISANKLYDYMFSEKPILHSFSGKGDIVKSVGCGISVEAENPKAIAEGILKVYNMSEEERNKMGKRGKDFLLQNHTYKVLADEFEEVLNAYK